MKVLHLMRTWAMGGAQAIALSLFRHLPELGIEQLFLPYAANRSADDEFLSEALRLGMPVTDARLPWNGVSGWRHCQQLIRETVSRERIDVIHTHDNQSNTLVGMGRSPGARVATAYGWWDLNFKVKVYYALERHLALPRFDRVTTVSEHMKSKIVAGGTPADRIDVIHTGLEPEAFLLHPDRAGIRGAAGSRRAAQHRGRRAWHRNARELPDARTAVDVL